MLCGRRRSQVYLPTYKLVLLAILRKLAELFVSELGNDLGSHALIVHRHMLIMLIDYSSKDSEPAVKIEEVGERQFPAGKLAGGQFLLSREGRIDEVLFPLQLQDLHGLGHGLKKPDLRDSRLSI